MCERELTRPKRSPQAQENAFNEQNMIKIINVPI